MPLDHAMIVVQFLAQELAALRADLDQVHAGLPEHLRCIGGRRKIERPFRQSVGPNPVQFAGTVSAQARDLISIHQEALGLPRGIDLAREPNNCVIRSHGRWEKPL
jgi:hypothetical protein